MRADFFGKCAEYGKLTQQIQENLVTVTPMTDEELRQAITEPAKQVSLQIEPELVNQMIVDVEGSPGSLPLLQYTLTELWQQRTEDKLTVSAYTRLGGVKGTLQKRATEIYENLSPEEQTAAKRIFLELTQLGEGTEDTRRRVLLQDLVTSQPSNNNVETFHETSLQVEQVIQKLADAKLIVTSTLIEKGAESGKVAVVDVAHEALIRHWSLLRKWLDENRDKLRQKRKIEAAAEEWREKRKAKDYLLQGKPLQDAKAFQKQQVGNLALSNLAEEFISKSLKHKWVRSLKTASLLTIPILVALFAVVPVIRKQSYNEAWKIIRSQDQKQGKRAALELLTEGCWERKQWQWIPTHVASLLFGGCPSFYGEDLSFANLRGAKLNYADLWGAKLRGADLSDAELFLADFSSADLRDANLNRADLRDANLRGADLSDAKLFLANLRGADLSGADLNGADLRLADLSGADLSLAYLSDAKLSDAKLSSANLSDADLSDADLSRADLERAVYNKKTKFPENFDPVSRKMLLIAPGVNLSGKDLSNLGLRFTDLKGVNLSNANLDYTDLSGADLSGADLSGANLIYANISFANLSFANISFANLSFANLSTANLSFANLSYANLSYANLSRTDLRGANLSRADLRDANLERAVYNKATEFPNNFNPAIQQMLLIALGVNLSGADLSFLKLYHVDLKDVNFSNANLDNADLSYAKNLTPEQVKSAKNWEKAKYDREFRKKLGLK